MVTVFDDSPLESPSQHRIHDTKMTNEPTDTDATTAEPFTDPESLRDREDVPFRAETKILDRETFETVSEQSETDDGAAIVGITNDDGEVLLKDTCTGWLAPGGNVAPGDDWAAVARREVEAWTGVAVDIDGVERVRRIDHRVEGDEPPDRLDDPFYLVFFRASLAPGEAAPVDSDDEDAPEVEWFDEVPEGVDPNHEDDVGVFFD
jgi:ADP-ribose pyrophosphatase YjhB (NUDIX family)